MSLCKILDTCTMINIFVESGLDTDGFFHRYDSVTTPAVIEEYTRKYPRIMPGCLKIAEFDDSAEKLYMDSEYLFPGLGPGERSAFALAVNLLPTGKNIIILSDDRKAVKRLSEFCADEESLELFPGIDRIRWGDTRDVLRKMAEHNDISRVDMTAAFRKLKL